MGSEGKREPVKRRRYSATYKRQVVEETFEPDASVSVVARRHDVNANQLFRWRKEYRDGLLETGGELVPIRMTAPAPSGPSALPKTVDRTSEGGVDILLRGGHRVVVRGDADVAVLRTVLEVLGR